MKTKTIALLNEKGGVLKTTTAVHLAVALARRGKRVLVIDVDSQRHASRWLTKRASEDDPEITVYEVFQDVTRLKEAILKSAEPGVDVLYASRKLGGIESVLGQMSRPIAMLRYLVDQVKGTYDYVLIDCPPSVGRLTANALVAADELICPIDASDLAVDGFKEVMKTLNAVTGDGPQHERKELPRINILFAKFDTRLKVAKDIMTLFGNAQAPYFTFSTVIRQNARANEAFSRSLTLFEYDAGGRTDVDYTSLAEEVDGGAAA